jgi:hypothetical protein
MRRPKVRLEEVKRRFGAESYFTVKLFHVSGRS